MIGELDRDSFGKIARADLRCEQIDADADRRARLPPTRGLTDRGAQHPMADCRRQRHAIQDREELRGRELTVDRMVPAQQCLGTDHPPFGKRILRLIEELELAAFEGVPKFGLHPAPGFDLLAQMRFEEDDRAAAALLGLVEREVRAHEQRLDRCDMKGSDRNADARVELECVAVDIEAAPEAVAQLGRHALDFARIAEPRDQEREFVAAEPREEAVWVAFLAQPLADDRKQAVADRVTEHVVDVLEAVEIE